MPWCRKASLYLLNEVTPVLYWGTNSVTLLLQVGGQRFPGPTSANIRRNMSPFPQLDYILHSIPLDQAYDSLQSPDHLPGNPFMSRFITVHKQVLLCSCNFIPQDTQSKGGRKQSQQGWTRGGMICPICLPRTFYPALIYLPLVASGLSGGSSVGTTFFR